jgi:hypothetical protein
MGVDPWDEAASLAASARECAAQKVVQMLAAEDRFIYAYCAVPIYQRTC